MKFSDFLAWLTTIGVVIFLFTLCWIPLVIVFSVLQFNPFPTFIHYIFYVNIGSFLFIIITLWLGAIIAMLGG